MRTRPTLGTLGAVAFLLGLTACGGSSETPSTATPEPAAPSTTETAATYSLEDRESFLASAPSCDELRAWYTQFPADTDGLTALRFVEECQEAPEPILNGDIFPGENERLMQALLDPAVTGASRTAAHEALAQGVCSLFADGEKSLWLVGSTVRDYGGTPPDYVATVDAAVTQCPGSQADLELFDTDDVLGATTQFGDELRSAGADLSMASSDAEIAALAGVTCSSLRDGDSPENASLLLTVLVDSESEASRLSQLAADLFCSQLT